MSPTPDTLTTEQVRVLVAILVLVLLEREPNVCHPCAMPFMR
jgi:hypothetical protein